jgi:RluA family pseudouridine synthase
MELLMKWTVSSEESGVKLLAFLVKHMEGQSAKSLKRAIESNSCQINGRIERFASSIVGHGDVIELQVIEKADVKFDKSRILFEDEALLIYNKPPGINCDEEGVVRMLKKYAPTIRLVHRLDRDTSGVLILAKSDLIFSNLVEQFKMHQVEKIYKALVDGIVKRPKGTIDNYLVKERAFAGQTIWGEVDAPPGLHAITDWVCLQKGNGVSLILCYPRTGRTHQLRVHLAGMGHPILGDVQYGKKVKSQYKPGRYLLHAEAIKFKHPLTMEELNIQAPLPSDFIKSQKDLFERQFE